MPDGTDTFVPLRALTGPTSSQRASAARPPRPAKEMTERVRVDGKFFARGGRRMRARGVTYGPFKPGPDGQPFPPPERAKEDFLAMRDAGVNAVRTYHLPPAWLFDLADEQGLSLF